MQERKVYVMDIDRIFQKVAGVFFVTISVLSVCLNEAGIAVLFVPFGLYLLFTKKQVMYF